MTSGPPDSRKKRFSHDEASAALIGAGKKLLVERGLDAGLGLVSLNDAIIEAGVPRASAYRAFTNEDLDPQVAFRSQLITEFIRDEARERLAEDVVGFVQAGLAAIDRTSAEEFSIGIRELLRVAMESNINRLVDDPAWRIIAPSWAATSLARHVDPILIEAHIDVSRRAHERVLPLYRELVQQCGWRLRPGMTPETVALLIESCTIGGSFYAGLGPDHRIQRPTGKDGAFLPWATASIMLEGLLYACVEPDPDAPESVDLRGWLSA